MIDELRSQILNAIPLHPEILRMKDPYALCKVKGFPAQKSKVPSFAQRLTALKEAQRMWYAKDV